MEPQNDHNTMQKRSSLVIMLTVIVIILAVILLGLIGYIFLYRKSSNRPVTPTPSVTKVMAPPSTSVTPSINGTTFCIPAQLKSTVQLSSGAGNVYGTFMITNISDHACKVIGDSFIQVHYDSDSIKNLVVEHSGNPSHSRFTLQPQSSVYSQVHYPNGPQCNGPTVTDQVSFTYAISDTDSVTFKDIRSNSNTFSVNGCSAANDTTTITIWNLSNEPITP